MKRLFLLLILVIPSYVFGGGHKNAEYRITREELQDVVLEVLLPGERLYDFIGMKSDVYLDFNYRFPITEDLSLYQILRDHGAYPAYYRFYFYSEEDGFKPIHFAYPIVKDESSELHGIETVHTLMNAHYSPDTKIISANAWCCWGAV